jgi:thiol-disulfide isomerase/thioredoxin
VSTQSPRNLSQLSAASSLALLLACASPGALASGSGPQGAALTSKITESGPVAVGKPAPGFGGFDVTGREILSLEKIRLSPSPAPVLVSFGASFCKPCREGLPRLKSFVARHPEVRLVLVDVEADQEAAAAFAKEQGIALAVLDKFEVAAKAYGVAQGSSLTLPRTFLLAANGRVGAIYRTEGPDLEAVLEVDLAALVAPAPAAPAR